MEKKIGIIKKLRATGPEAFSSYGKKLLGHSLLFAGHMGVDAMDVAGNYEKELYIVIIKS